MSKRTVYAGIDVSGDWLDVYVHPSGGGDVVASVEVDEEFDVGTDGIAYRARNLDPRAQPSRRDIVSMLQRHHIVELKERIHLERRMPLGDRLERGLGVLNEGGVFFLSRGGRLRCWKRRLERQLP